MNLSEESIKFLEKKAFLRGMEAAAEIVSGGDDGYKLEVEIEKLQEELEGQQYDGGLDFPAGLYEKI